MSIERVSTSKPSRTVFRFGYTTPIIVVARPRHSLERGRATNLVKHCHVSLARFYSQEGSPILSESEKTHAPS
jgi:hypothetical protein